MFDHPVNSRASSRPYRTIALLLVLAVAGCSGNANKPIVDMKGVNPYLYEEDLAECSEYADQVAVGQKAATGAAAGAAVGAAIGVIWDGERGGSPARGAATGAVLDPPTRCSCHFGEIP